MPAIYDAFISYSHARDKPIAAALLSVVRGLGKAWHQRRLLRVCRDDTSLSAAPGLWPAIEQALDRSQYLILLTSPEAAASRWVNKEVAYWLEHKSADTLLIALTDGTLAWDDGQGGFARDAPLPPALAGRLSSEPKWVDLTAFRDSATLGSERFTELAADLAAAVRGVPKEDLLSQELREQRRALRLAWLAASALLVFAVAAVWQWRAAVEQRNRAERSLRSRPTPPIHWCSTLRRSCATAPACRLHLCAKFSIAPRRCSGSSPTHGRRRLICAAANPLRSM